ncbi:STAS domain-containing protein [Streptomyces sp. PmtG]
MTSGSKSVLFGISSISSCAALVFPAPNAPLIQTITVPPLLLAPSGLPATQCHGNQPLMRATTARPKAATSCQVPQNNFPPSSGTAPVRIVPSPHGGPLAASVIRQAPRPLVTSSFRLLHRISPGRTCRPGPALGGLVHQDELSEIACEIPDLPPRVYESGDSVVVELRGDIDIVAFQRALPVVDPVTSGGAETVVIDLTHTTFFDCSGLALLLRAQRRLASRGGQLRVVCSDPMTLRMMGITGVRISLSPVASLREALARPGPEP